MIPIPKQHPEPFTQLPHWIWKEEIKPLAKLVLFAIYRWTAGFGRATYKISDSRITKMTGITVIKTWRKYLIERGYIQCEYINGKGHIYTIPPPSRSRRLPSTNTTGTPNTYNGHPLTEFNGSRGSKEQFIELLKKDSSLLEFKNEYPAEKLDDELDHAWSSLSNDHKKIAVEVMEYQKNKWDDPNFNRKYIPKASNFILKRKFLDDEVLEPYKSEIRREKAKIKQREYFQKAEQEDSATPEEIQEILKDVLKPADKERNNNGTG